MEIALEAMPAAVTATNRITVEQLHGVTDAFANIDSSKRIAPHEMPKLISACRYRIHNLTAFRFASADIVIKNDEVNALSSLLRLIEDAHNGHQPELILSFIESAYNLIAGIAGDKKDLIFPGDDE